MKVLMIPHISHFRSEESGIKRVVQAYFKYLPDFGIEFVPPDSGKSYDLTAVHAGMSGADTGICHLHGLYWTADYDSSSWEYDANRRIVEAIRGAKEITVPSHWVSETFQRDLRYNPTVIPHGIEWQEWQHTKQNRGYVLWNKNRIGDVCSADALDYLAIQNPQIPFVATFGNGQPNVTLTKILPHAQMKKVIQGAGVYLSSTKETFGIGVLEAMAAGVPVLGWAYGGNVDLVQHGVNGYLAKPNDYNDLQEGLAYCFRYRQILGDNGREMAKAWTWQAACEKVYEVYRRTVIREDRPMFIDSSLYEQELQKAA